MRIRVGEGGASGAELPSVTEAAYGATAKCCSSALQLAWCYLKASLSSKIGS